MDYHLSILICTVGECCYLEISIYLQPRTTLLELLSHCYGLAFFTLLSLRGQPAFEIDGSTADFCHANLPAQTADSKHIMTVLTVTQTD